MRKYYDRGHAHGRLMNTVVWYNKELYNVEGVPSVGEILIIHPDTDDMHKISLDDQNLIIQPDELGYINVGDSCVYVSRLPKRQWKTALRHETIRICSKHLLAHKHWKLLLKNLYLDKPSLTDALDLLHSYSCVAVAIDANYCIAYTKETSVPVLHYKTIPIGWFVGKVLHTSNDCKHLLDRVLELEPELEVVI